MKIVYKIDKMMKMKTCPFKLKMNLKTKNKRKKTKKWTTAEFVLPQWSVHLII